MLSVLAALGISLIGPAPAQADVTPTGILCDTGISCSEIVNETSASLFIAQDWCWGGTTGSSTESDPYCSDPVTERRWLGGHSRTPSNQDWDTFRVDSGWCYLVAFSTGLTRYYNQVGRGAAWVKVEDTATAFIKSQRFGSC